ncbi:MAG TPA: C39 family peptidase [Candidatus Limnocylindrales bacterium]
MNRRSLLGTAFAVTTATVAGVTGQAFAGDKKKPPGSRDIVMKRWNWNEGTLSGARVDGSTLVFDTATGSTQYTDPASGVTRTYDTATWTSPAASTTFNAQEIIPSWTASTPGGSFVRIEIQYVTAAGTTTKWYNLGNWASDDTFITRTSVSAQGDTNAFVAVDTLVANEGFEIAAWTARLTLLRPAGSADTPSVRSFATMASAMPDPGKLVPSVPGAAQGVILNVPQYSQEVHIGEYPQWDGGGEAWCSPTSTAMVLAYWGLGPSAEDLSWVDPSFQDPQVDFAARNTFDFTYNGCGNWPFNAAYAGRFGAKGFVTRLRSLNEAEQFIAAGIPLVASASFKKSEIPGMDYGTGGHLMVIAGFTGDGRLVLNDPFAPTNAGVRKLVGRAEWEAAWLNTSRGVVYVIHPAHVALPAPPAQANW